ncbi:uncharacterized protein LOC118439152 [Folsomia candida]|uniref:uncharacterized protein LOC118439152 n=1 Tax=Folsomia candida TaxID=158441 RepID=UPI001604FAFF|nr:uncharacterized protein LOC118439152 [Folsomia candida]
MREFFVIGLSILELLVFTGYFYWLADCASGLEENSKTFCKLVKYSSFEGRNKDGGKDLQIVLEHIKLYQSLVSLQPISIRNSVLDLNLRLLVSMVAAMTTYLVVIVQFQVGDTS